MIEKSKNLSAFRRSKYQKSKLDLPEEQDLGRLENNLLKEEFPKKGGLFKLPNLSGRDKKIVLGGVLVLLLFLFFFGVLPFWSTYRAIRELDSSARVLVVAVKSQNLPETKTTLLKVKSDLSVLGKNLSRLSWIRFIPLFGVYWSDANHLVRAGIFGIEAIEELIPVVEPYADILGFDKGGEAGDGAKTAEDRINFVVETIGKIAPKLDSVGEKLGKARDEVNKIDPLRYPQKLGKIEARAQLSLGIFLINEAARLVNDGKPLIENADFLLGIGETRTYLVLFQNDKELRPTGGFLTAYALMRVRDGKIQPVSSDDIYNLDKRYRPALVAPEPFLSFIKQPYSQNSGWRLRDMNWSPDFKKSIDTFLPEAQKAGLGKVDGVIGVDTEILVRLLSVIGKIGVPGYGNYSSEIDSRCACPQVIYELETYADVERPIVWDPVTGKIVYGQLLDNRKGIVGPLVNSVLANALGQPKDKVPALFEAVLSSVLEKHVLFYMFNPKIQEGFEIFNIAGRIKDFEGDFLHITDANLGGRKSNLYVEQEVRLEIKSKGEKLEHFLEITYKNPQPHDGWLNSVLPNYLRVYVPKDAKLIKAEGFEEKEGQDMDLGKTVFAGFLRVRPQGVSKITLLYEIPKEKVGHLLIQKQPGTRGATYQVKVDSKTYEFKLVGDREIVF